MSAQVVVHPYRERWGSGTDLQSRQMTQHVSDIIHQELQPNRHVRIIDVFNLGGEAQDFKAGHERRLVIYFGSAFKEVPQDLVEVKIGDELVAQYSKSLNEINITPVLTEVYNQENMEHIKKIMQAVQEQVYEKEMERMSYIKSDERESLVKQFAEHIQMRNRANLEEDKHRARSMEMRIEEYKQKIRRSYDEMLRLRNIIEAVESGDNRIEEKITKELDLIAQMDMVRDIRIEGEKINILTEDIYAYGSNSSKRYHIGTMRIEINMNNTQVKFFNPTNSRPSYWTSSDPHPHVDGNDGNPCLGNVSSTIAELCSQNELYALAMVSIDFLENANEDDPAGRNVINWDEVDEEGNIIREGGEEFWVCDHCNEAYNEDAESYTAYMDTDGEDVVNEVEICTDCREHDFYYSEYYDEIVHVDVDEPEEEN